MTRHNPATIVRYFLFSIIASLCSLTFVAAQETDFKKVEIKDLRDWDIRTEESKWWRIQDSEIVGGSLSETIPYNTFIATKDEYQNFELKLKIKIEGTEGFVNSGVQIRSIRVPDNSEMKGYQVDAGDGWWGKLYDESRRNKVISESKDLDRVNQSIKKQGWNEYRIVADGPKIRTWINGVEALDYAEPDSDIPLDGKIGFQVHGGGKALVTFKDIEIRRLPDTPGAPSWKTKK